MAMAVGRPAGKQTTSPMEAFRQRKPRPEYVLRAALAYACTQVGSGLLALAPAVGYAGWIGVPVIVLCGLCAAYTSYTLGWTIFRLQAATLEEGNFEDMSTESGSDASSVSSSSGSSGQESFQSYEDVSEQALGIGGRIIALLLQGLMLVGVCTIFLVLIGVNAFQLEEMYQVTWLTKRQLVLLAAAVEFVPCVLVATVKETFTLTAVGAACSAVVAVVVVIAAFTTSPATIQPCLDSDARIQWPFITDLKGLSLCWNTVVFSFGGINCLPTLLADFHSRGVHVLARALVSFTWRSYLFIIFFYVMVAIAGFAVGGNAMASPRVDSNVLIGLHGCQDKSVIDWSLVVAFASISLHVILAMPVPFHACAETLEVLLGIREKTMRCSWPGGLLWRLPRFLLLAGCTGLAYALPFFGALLNVVAAIAGQGTVFILPIILSWAIQRQQKYRVRSYDWLLGILCLLVGILGAITGLYFGLQDLAAALHSWLRRREQKDYGPQAFGAMGVCGGKPQDGPVEENEVILNVYDVGTSIAMHDLNNVLHFIGTGVYHAGTQIGEESEWGYGFCEKGSGVFHCPPKHYPFTFRESIHLGKSPLSKEEIATAMEKLKKQFQGPDYDLLHQNCCHFAVALCKALKVQEVPAWVTNLAAAGAAIMAEEHALEDALHFAAVQVVSGADGLGLAIKDAIMDAAKAGKIAEECFERDCMGRHKIKAKAKDILLRAGHLKPQQANLCCAV